jgi:hypothetical protein
MAEQKTKPTKQSVEAFISKVPDERVRDDCYTLIRLMKKITGEEPKMWGPSIVGFGRYHYKYDSGHEGYSCLTGFSPRKPAITLYVMPGFEAHSALVNNLGKYRAGKGCLYVKRLSDIHLDALERLISISVHQLKATYP